MKRHNADLVSLTFATLFLCALGVWLVGDVANLDLPQPGWTIAAALIFFGTLGLAKTWRTGRENGSVNAYAGSESDHHHA
ncbi:MAG: hypothetical protein JXA67_13870 [Micromonosporaceae bacterium]|nr:hypothetical protein [Micromonosporaceae bacterium]